MTPLLQFAVRHKRAALVWAVLSLSVLLAPRGAVRAAAFCVHDSAGLQAALDTAASNGESDEIRVGTGLYLAPVGGFTYNPSPPDANLTIVGGWKPPFDFGCLLNEQNPAQTVLTGNGSGPVMKIIARDGNATLRLLTFEDGQAGSGGTAGLSLDSPINLDPNAHDSYTFTVERNLFVFNQGGAFGGLRVMMVDGLMQVINNVFAWNDASQSAALHLTALGQTLIYVSNNSVLHNVGSGTAAIAIHAGAPAPAWLYNNLFYDNDTADINLNSTGYVELQHNNLFTRIGATPVLEEATTSIVPTFQSGGFLCLNCFTLERASPLVDAGLEPAPSFPFWYLTATDAKGGPRDIEGVDIGAFETDRLFRNGFDPPFIPL